MANRAITDDVIELTKILDSINVLTPQSSHIFNQTTKMHYLRHAVLAPL